MKKILAFLGRNYHLVYHFFSIYLPIYVVIAFYRGDLDLSDDSFLLGLYCAFIFMLFRMGAYECIVDDLVKDKKNP